MADDTIWNVSVPVVVLVPAASADEAIDLLRRKLSDDGYDCYDLQTAEAGYSAFESEPLPAEVESNIRADWRCPFTNWGVQCVRSAGHDDPDGIGGHQPPVGAWWHVPRP